MGFWQWSILILTILFVLLCLYAIKILGNQKHKYYLMVRRVIPFIIFVVIMFYGGLSIYRYYEYMLSSNASFKGLITNNTTYTTIVNFVTLLAFYQVLVDRVDKLKEKQEIEISEEGIPISKFKVITYSEHKKLIQKAENAIHEKYRNQR